MRCTRCGICCQETEMLLSKRDIASIEKKGYTQSFFVDLAKDGYITLKNNQGHCVFYNLEKQQCNIYDERPIGCRVYPVIFDEEKGIVADTICSAHKTVTDQEKRHKGQKVISLLKLIDQEAKNRS